MKPAQANLNPKGASTRSFRLVCRIIEYLIKFNNNEKIVTNKSYLILNHKLDPCDKITCNGTNAQCQVYLGGPKEGDPFCTCPQGFRGDPNINCGKNAYIMLNNWLYHYIYNLNGICQRTLYITIFLTHC